jgi:hypothetical protein
LCGFESLCTKRVLWILGSTDCHLIQLFHLGFNARFQRRRQIPFGRGARSLGLCQPSHLLFDRG